MASIPTAVSLALLKVKGSSVAGIKLSSAALECGRSIRKQDVLCALKYREPAKHPVLLSPLAVAQTKTENQTHKKLALQQSSEAS